MSEIGVKSQTLNNTPIGKFPLDWNVVTINDLAVHVGSGITPKGGSNIYKKEGILFIRSQNVTSDGLSLDDVAHIDERTHHRMQRSEVFAHDVLLNITGASIGRCCPLPEGLGTANVNQHVCAIRLPKPSREDAIFLSSVLTSFIGQSQIDKLNAGGNREGLNYEQLRSFLVPFPSSEERAGIAQILDTIDQLIAVTDTHITKLKKTKAGLLHDLLTRGIDEHGELRDPTRHPEQFQDSLLGRIPHNWQIEALESICLDIVDCPHTTPIFRDEGVLIVRTSKIRDGVFYTSEASYISEEDYIQRISRLQPESGDVIFTREAPVGEAFVIPEGMRVCLGQRTMLLRPNPDKVIGDYIVAQIYSEIIKSRINQITGGTTNPHLNVAEVRAFSVPVPEVQEQKRIIEVLKKQNLCIQQKGKLREKLKLLKKGLMTDLLTGRVRVKKEER